MRKVIWAFAAGQVVQIIFHATCLNWWGKYQLPYCVAAGVLILAAVIAGAWIGMHGEPKKKKKSYMDYANGFTDEQ